MKHKHNWAHDHWIDAHGWTRWREVKKCTICGRSSEPTCLEFIIGMIVVFAFISLLLWIGGFQ